MARAGPSLNALVMNNSSTPMLQRYATQFGRSVKQMYEIMKGWKNPRNIPSATLNRIRQEFAQTGHKVTPPRSTRSQAGGLPKKPITPIRMGRLR